MKRDFNLIRLILLDIEKGIYREIEIERYSPEEVINHVILMYESGLLNKDQPNYITMWGHDFLDLCRPEDRWNRVMEQVRKVNGVPFDILIMLLNRETINELGLSSRPGTVTKVYPGPDNPGPGGDTQ